MSDRFHTLRLQNSEDEYLAIGARKSRMRLYLIEGDSLIRTRLAFPACTRFMPELDGDEEGELLTLAEIEQVYGPVPTSIKVKTETGPLSGAGSE